MNKISPNGMTNTDNKNWFIIFALIFGLFGAVYLAQQRQETRRQAAYGNVAISVLPDEKTVGIGENINLQVMVNPGPNLVNLVKMTLDYDEDVLEFVDVSVRNGFTGSDTSVGGKIEFTALTTMARDELERLNNEPFHVATLTFEAKQTGLSEINRAEDYVITGSRGLEGNVDRQLSMTSFGKSTITVVSEVVPVETPTDIPEATNTPPPGTTNTPTPETTSTPIPVATSTPTGGPEGGWPELTFKIKFEGTEYRVGGIMKTVDDIGTQFVDLLVKGNGVSSKYEDVPVVFDSQAIGNGSVELVGVQPGEGYAILIKGPVHLAKRFCKDDQKEHCWLGEEEISLASGENNFDWTDINLEPGDIDKNGVVNSADFTLLKEALKLEGDVEEDINFNGIVNGQDITFFLNTLSTKYEDDI